jgi:hypothetical protein
VTLPAQEWFAGTATPMNAQDDGSAVAVMWYNGSKSQDIGAKYFSRGFLSMSRVPPTEFRGGSNDVAWVAVHNQYFMLAVMPMPMPKATILMWSWVLVFGAFFPRRSYWG